MIHGISIDVEDWYQSTFDPDAPLTERFERSTDQVLACLAETHTKGTFFVLGMAAEKRPSLVKRIAGEGHEIQSHGYGHRSNDDLDTKTLRQDLLRAKELLEDITGQEIYGYRAPSFSINKGNMWALDVLAETGHRYDSSIFPIKMPRYGVADYPMAPAVVETPSDRRIVEAPVAVFTALGKRVPVGGGGYFRLWPYAVIRQAWRQMEKSGRPGIAYIHPYEYDPTEMSQYRHLVSIKGRIHQGLGRRSLPKKVRRLLSDFTFGPIREVIADQLHQLATPSNQGL